MSEKTPQEMEYDEARETAIMMLGEITQCPYDDAEDIIDLIIKCAVMAITQQQNEITILAVSPPAGSA